MVKKFVLGTLLVGLIAILVVGAVIRTIDKTGNVVEARGQGHGNDSYTTTSQGEGQGQGQGQGRGAGGQGRATTGEVERLYPNYEVAPEDWATYEGSVVQAPAAGVDMVIETASGEEIVIGTGPSYLEDQGFGLQAGEQVQVEGYWEDGEFKAAQVTRLRDGATVSLRDEVGRPAWAGGGQGAQSAGAGGFDAEGNTDALGDGTGTGQAVVDEWLTLSGTVISVDADALVVQTAEGEVTVENRPWWFAQESGFGAQVGDQVTLTGFYEDGAFEVGQIDDLTSGQTVSIRDENGRPGWAGRGRRGS